MRACSKFLLPRQRLQLVRNGAKVAGPPTRAEEVKTPKKLPVPDMNKAFVKYMRSVRPFLSSSEYVNTEKMINEFTKPGGVGEQIHLLLHEKAKDNDNWLKEWWLNTAYLGYRAPLVVFSSPAEVLPKIREFTSEADMLLGAATAIHATLEFKSLIDCDKVKPEFLGKDPLDMSQYKLIFGTYRIPSCPQDRLVYHPDSKHIVVMYNNDVYKVPVAKQDGDGWISKREILSQLQSISSCLACPGPSVGILTSDNRDNWAKAYELLYEDATNKSHLKVIEESLFVVCLDTMCPKVEINQLSTSASNAMHGNGALSSGGNRWYDKTIQLIVSREGSMGIAYEHSPAEGGPIAILTDHIVKALEDKKALEVESDCELDKELTPEKLCFNVNCEVKELITTAQCNLDKLVDDIEMCSFCFGDFGKEALKELKVSPDSFIQMAIQFAFYRLHQEPGAQYETASLRKFKDGRTETVRSASMESIRMAKAMLDGCLPNQSRANAVRVAINTHKDYTMQAMNGEGIDRYLLGLKVLAKENNMPQPQLFADNAYTRSTHFRLSTSQVPSKSDSFMLYGPLTTDGYSCCYNPRDNNINFGMTSFNSSSSTSAAKFKEMLSTSLNEMRETLLRSPKAKL